MALLGLLHEYYITISLYAMLKQSNKDQNVTRQRVSELWNNSQTYSKCCRIGDKNWTCLCSRCVVQARVREKDL